MLWGETFVPARDAGLLEPGKIIKLKGNIQVDDRTGGRRITGYELGLADGKIALPLRVLRHTGGDHSIPAFSLSPHVFLGEVFPLLTDGGEDIVTLAAVRAGWVNIGWIPGTAEPVKIGFFVLAVQRWFWDPKLPTDCPCSGVFYFSMPWDGGYFPVGWIFPDTVIAAFSG